jgi:hypothetical protein
MKRNFSFLINNILPWEYPIAKFWLRPDFAGLAILTYGFTTIDFLFVNDIMIARGACSMFGPLYI